MFCRLRGQGRSRRGQRPARLVRCSCENPARRRSRMTARVPWSDRRRRTLIGLGAGTVVLGAASFLPDEYGVTSLFLAALCAFLFVVATIVFVVVPGPDTFGTLLRSTALAGP